MEESNLERTTGATSDDRLESVSTSWRVAGHMYANMGSPLYSALAAQGADDPEILQFAGLGLDFIGPIHMFACVHYLILQNPDDPLARYFGTITEDPAPPEEAFPDFARFCRQHRDELLHLIETRTMQATYVFRCGAVMPALSMVADLAGEPLHIVEIGCSGGLLLAFDKIAYDVEGQVRLGPADAEITLAPDYRNAPPLRIPAIASRTGIDLNTLDANDADDRLWLLAQCYPELTEDHKLLIRALDTIAKMDIRMLQGDALTLLPDVIHRSASPICVFHSASVFYWGQEAQSALDDCLREASHNKEIYRVSLEPSARFREWQQVSRDSTESDQDLASRVSFDIELTLYSGGEARTTIAARGSHDYHTIEWLADHRTGLLPGHGGSVGS